MNKIIVLLIVLISSNIYGQSLSEEETINVKEFLTEFRASVISQDTIKVESMIRFIVTDDANNRKEIVNSVLSNNELRFGDFSYSNRAMDIVVDSLVAEFKYISTDVRSMLEGLPAVKKEMANYTNNEIAILDYQKCHIVLLLNENDIEMFFWEGMNYLLPN